MAFRFEKLTHKAQEAVQRAQELASDAGNPQMEPAHLLAALLDEGSEGIVRPVLEKLGANVGQLEKIVDSELKHLPRSLGYIGAWSMPIRSPRNGAVLGTFGTYYRDRREPTAHEVKAIGKLAGLAARALERDAMR